jgi:hypothetical protein
MDAVPLPGTMLSFVRWLIKLVSQTIFFSLSLVESLPLIGDGSVISSAMTTTKQQTATTKQTSSSSSKQQAVATAPVAYVKETITKFVEMTAEWTEEDLVTFAKGQHPAVAQLIDQSTALFPTLLAKVEEHKVSVTKGYMSAVESVTERSNLITTRVTGALKGTFRRRKRSADADSKIVVAPTSVRPVADADLQTWCLKAELVTSSRFPFLNVLHWLGMTSPNSGVYKCDQVVAAPNGATKPVYVRAQLVEVASEGGDRAFRYVCQKVVPTSAPAPAASFAAWLAAPAAPSAAAASEPRGMARAWFRPASTPLKFKAWNAQRREWNLFRWKALALLSVPVAVLCVLLADMHGAAVRAALVPCYVSAVAAVSAWALPFAAPTAARVLAPDVRRKKHEFFVKNPFAKKPKQHEEKHETVLAVKA